MDMEIDDKILWNKMIFMKPYNTTVYVQHIWIQCISDAGKVAEKAAGRF